MRLQPFVVTLCGLLIYRGIARYYTQDATAGFGFGESFPTLEWLTAGRSDICAVLRLVGYHGATVEIPHSLIALVIVAVVAGVVLHRSIFGRYLFAVGKNEEAARYSGINSDRIVVSAYVICSGLTGGRRRSSSPCTRARSRRPRTATSTSSTRSRRRCSEAARCGEAKARSSGVVLGTILLQILQNLVNLLGIPSSLNFAVMGTVILIGVIADQQFFSYRRAAGERGRVQSGAAAPKAAE